MARVRASDLELVPRQEISIVSRCGLPSPLPTSTHPSPSIKPWRYHC